MPDALLRKGRNVFQKQQTAEEERGLQITRLVIGYLNWSEPDAYSDSDVFKSPLIVIPVVLGKERSSEGEKFFLRQTEDPYLNPILERKLEIDASLDITSLKELFSEETNGIDIEKVFKITSEMAPKVCKIWEVKREATIGTYPFQGIDLYQDLDPQNIDFSNFNVLESLLVGKDTEGPTGANWEDFDVDGAKAEQLVPHLVMNADSSQFTALSKVANGENVALEGPPGSGKSQTIVNAIANAIFSGKKVLFVAQKMTALEVVNSRLQSLGLDKFVLPMVGAKSDTDGFYSALENRLKLTKKQEPRDIETLKRQLEQQRNTLTSYIALMQEKVGGTNLTVHEVMGLFTQNSDVVPELPFSLRSIKLPFERFSPSFDLQDFKSCQLEIVRCAGVFYTSQNWMQILLGETHHLNN